MHFEPVKIREFRLNFKSCRKFTSFCAFSSGDGNQNSVFKGTRDLWVK